MRPSGSLRGRACVAPYPWPLPTARALSPLNVRICIVYDCLYPYTIGGAERWYYLHVPPQHDGSTPMPLVLDLHGYSEGAQIHLAMSGLGAFGDSKGFVTVTPQGQGTVARWDTEETSRRIELQVGRDLQWIRVNGTVVGGLAGLVIYTIAQLLG